jgi:hypothetical protein
MFFLFPFFFFFFFFVVPCHFFLSIFFLLILFFWLRGLSLTKEGGACNRGWRRKSLEQLAGPVHADPLRALPVGLRVETGRERRIGRPRLFIIIIQPKIKNNKGGRKKKRKTIGQEVK